MKHKVKDKAKYRVLRLVVTFAFTIAVAISTFGQGATPTPSPSPSPSPSPAADPLAPFKTSKGLLSLTKVAPVMTQVWDYSGDLAKRTTMFGDFGGARTRLYEKGFTVDAQITQVFQGLTSGGSVPDNGKGAYNGLLEVNLTMDTAKVGLWKGGVIIVTEQTSFGRALKDHAGNLSPINATALWPKTYDTSSVLMEYHLVQMLPHKTLVIAGRVDPSNYMDQNSFSSTSDSQFLNVSMNSNTLWGSFMTYSTYAALFMTEVNKHLTVAYGAWTPNTAPGNYGGNWHDIGVAVIPMFNYKAAGHPGAIQFMLAYSTKNSTDVGNPRLLPAVLTGGTLPTKPSNWLFEASGEQFFWEPKGGSVPKAKGGRQEEFMVPTKDFAQAKPGFGIFYRFSYTPEDRNAFNTYFSGGFGGRGVIPGRPHDRFGVGGYWLKESNDLKRQPGVPLLLRNEAGFEAFYNIAITPWMQLTFDAQRISPGKRSSADGTALGTRLNFRF